MRGSFLRREDGSVAVEAMIILPVIFWAYLCMFAIYDAYRMFSVHQKAAFTISDAISRETMPIDDDYLDGTHDLFEYLSRSQGQTSMRVSQIWYDEDNDSYRADWSEVRGSISPLSDAQVSNWHDKLPVMPDNERIVLLETWSNYDTPFETGLTADEIRTYVFTSPRYAPAVCFDACN
ncbi:hypothetical protein H9Q16_01060 [Sulfitobacter sp. TSTF-M16]|uniref:Pilus assembly protein n=2 Tax=Sulfitobacter aestuariivivens TaxID=2766981 RepID=A0A927D219_9RHOB|nr:hypothetical protein [Sulfitobacter aestuariivivens]